MPVQGKSRKGKRHVKAEVDEEKGGEEGEPRPHPREEGVENLFGSRPEAEGGHTVVAHHDTSAYLENRIHDLEVRVCGGGGMYDRAFACVSLCGLLLLLCVLYASACVCVLQVSMTARLASITDLLQALTVQQGELVERMGPARAIALPLPPSAADAHKDA